MNLIKSCADWCRQQPRHVVFPDALDERAISAAVSLAESGGMHPVLLGNPLEIHSLALGKGIALGSVPIIDPATSSRLDAYAGALHQRLAKKGVSLEEARQQLKDPLWYGAMMLSAGDTDCCVAGNLSATSLVLKAALRVIGAAEGIKTVSSLFFMISPEDGRVFGFSDCGVVPEPTTEQLADIAISSADSYRNVTGDEARIAMLSFSSVGSVKHPSVTVVQEAVRMVRERRPDLKVDGELQFDAAFVPSVAARKVPGSLVAGSANVFVFPSLAAGNIGYKIAERLGGFSALGPMIQGLDLPMHDLSRGCSAQDMVEVSLLAMKMAFGGEGGHREMSLDDGRNAGTGVMGSKALKTATTAG
ncbi:phosphate acetyltransferase [Noviherbaspirillum saxi]|uniref:phosphate acetyltransferase n=1 Tax=Noviherbaspirillum saxi TaxID=2320863 RepID=A0A3A3G1W6_9BURK|nr:phosphate acetyltransferase [Noviherbaspirillum saxi]RJF92063.1 phosphate acetyltransferase [Noviherbaspirillum saxi]